MLVGNLLVILGNMLFLSKPPMPIVGGKGGKRVESYG